MESHMEGQTGYHRQSVTLDEISSTAVGFIVFAAMLMIMLGGFHLITGLVAIIDNAFYEQPREYFFDFNVDAWGWIHFVGGIIVLIAGFGLLSGAVWARIVAVFVALLSAIANFAFLPYYPVWSILMIALSIGVIWACIGHGRDVEVMSE